MRTRIVLVDSATYATAKQYAMAMSEEDGRKVGPGAVLGYSMGVLGKLLSTLAEHGTDTEEPAMKRPEDLLADYGHAVLDAHESGARLARTTPAEA